MFCRPDGSDIIFTNDEHLEEILNEEWNKPMTENHPPWMVYCIKGHVPAVNSPERHLEKKTVIGFRMHHSYGDGVSFFCALLPSVFKFKFIGDSPKTFSTLENRLKKKKGVGRTYSTQSSDSGHGASSDGQPSEESPSESDSPSSTPIITKRSLENVNEFGSIDLEKVEEMKEIECGRGGVQQTLATPGHAEWKSDSKKWKDLTEMEAKWYQVAMLWICGLLTMPFTLIR